MGGFDADLKHELEVHRAMLEGELAGQGMNDADVRRRAARTLGNVTPRFR